MPITNDVPINAGVGTYVETLQQSDGDGSHRQVVHVGDWKAAIEYAIEQIMNPLWVNSSAQQRISIENIAGSLTLSTITTVGTVTTVTTVSTVTTVGTVTTVSTVSSVTNLAQIGGTKADSMVMDAAMASWATCLRGRIT
jgi:hypothetical protein